MPTATVEESLLFSARLRLNLPPPSDEAGGRRGARRGSARREARLAAFVERILGLLELRPIRRRLAGTLSRGEAKRLTIGIELASSPSILFADEPTTALDAR
jgi:ABC-type multidrug transport system ATPase subunit